LLFFAWRLLPLRLLPLRLLRRYTSRWGWSALRNVTGANSFLASSALLLRPALRLLASLCDSC
jgi:hypothetical protein